MTRIAIQLDGMGQLLGQLKALGGDADDVMREVITDLVTDTHAIAVAGIQSGGGGRVYQKSNPNRAHRASSPGAYPAKWSALSGCLRGPWPACSGSAIPPRTARTRSPKG